MIERLDFGEGANYNAIEASIHLGRYALARSVVRGRRVLDAACGEGYGSTLLKKWGAAFVDAIDIDAETIDKANTLFGQDGVRFQRHTCEELPFEDQSFDVVCSFETIEHIDHPEAFLREIKRVLKPGGVAIISCPNDPYYSQHGIPDNIFHKRKYTYFDFQELAEPILGKAAQYLLSFGINGFMTMPLEKSVLPSENNLGNTLPQSMNALLNYEECPQALQLASDRYLNYWNCNYYVGIWGPPMEVHPDLVAFPREWFSELTEADAETWLREQYDLPAAGRLVTQIEELNAQLQQQNERASAREQELQQQMEQQAQVAAQHEQELQQQMEQQAQLAAQHEQELQQQMEQQAQVAAQHEQELRQQMAQQAQAAAEHEQELQRLMQQTIDALQGQLEDSQSYCGYIKEQAAHDAHIGGLERQRISMFWELTCKEKEELSNSLWQARAELENAKNELSLIKSFTCKEKEELSNSLWQTRAELETVRCELENSKNELSLIKSSRGFKLLNIGFPIKRRIWKLFGKDI